MALGIPLMVGDVIANEMDLSCMKIAAHLNSRMFSVTLD